MIRDLLRLAGLSALWLTLRAVAALCACWPLLWALAGHHVSWWLW